MIFLCHVSLSPERTQDDETLPEEEHLGIIEAESKEDAIAFCEQEIGKWDMHRATINVTPSGKLMQIRGV